MFIEKDLFQVDGMDKYGYVYYPHKCMEGNGAAKCKIHVAFHGCMEQLNGMFGWEWMHSYSYT